MTINRRTFLTSLAALPALASQVTAAASEKLAQSAKPERITFLGYGGPFDALTKKYVADPFTKETGIPVTMRGGSSDLISSLILQKNRPQYDLVHIGFNSYTQLLLNDVCDPIDASLIPNFEHLYPIARGTHGIATTITAVAVVYNTDKIKRPITTWNDLWDPAFKGHVAIEQLPADYGVDTLLMAARLVGGSEHNIDPGFKKLQELKPNLGAIYTNSSQCQQLFLQGGIWIAPWYGGRVASTAAMGVPVAAAKTKEGEPIFRTMLCPLKGKWNPWVAKFMNMHLAVNVEQAFAKQFASGPSRMDVKLPPDVAKNVPYGKEDIAQLIEFDWNTIIPNLDAWTKRFNREIAS